MPTKYKPRPPKPVAGHRVLVYCDDNPREAWGWWCRDCPQFREANTSKDYADKTAAQHREDTAKCSQVSESSRPPDRTGVAAHT